ncbi:MAG: asparagine synthase (glutamine-hydrolyzing), partial [Pseudarcicella sp.]|nr:asparagine synthase (glutamine-hydrolyzing) [Pseudarcicella sp.]
ILDLSIAGKQPMHYLDRYTITFNGEIYNYLEIKETLLAKGYQFKSNSDTEVLLALYDAKKENCLADLDGMFAFAIWDKHTQELFCARDRFGEKPFYYHTDSDKSFYFASEMKALFAAGINKTHHEKMYFNYWFYDSIIDPENLKNTFFDQIYCLEPAHYLKYNTHLASFSIVRYWDLNPNNIDSSITEAQAQTKLSELLYSSVRKRLRSDVPVGSSLSGGLDSSVIVKLIEQVKDANVKQKTFSAKFPNYKKDESKYIQIMLDNLKIEGFGCFPNQDSMLANIDKIIYHQEEPFGSASINAQFEVMQLARANGVIVMLDGQGADEILCGYHGLADSFFYELKKTDKALYNEQLTNYKALQKNNQINSLSRRLRNNIIKDYLSNQQLNQVLALKAGMSETFKASVKKDFYETYKNQQFAKQYKFDTLNNALYYATTKGGLQELLRYADRNAMANSIETRLPFLSHQLVEYIFTLPAIMKVKDGFTKHILRKVADDLPLPKEITWRVDKIGYEPPQSDWMQKVSIDDKKKNYHFIEQEKKLSDSQKWKVFVSH